MPLVLLYLGEKVTRFPDEASAKKEGARLHTAEAPARIEITPSGGGMITSLKFDTAQSVWLSDGHS
jgi:hypothetical protein